MRYPRNLSFGGTIGYAAPSYGASIEPYASLLPEAIRKLKELGFEADLGPNCYAGLGVGISNSPDKCGEELTEWYCRAENDVLISVGGGELMCETMDFVDFARIREAEPKWFMGYSDNTNFSFLLTTLCDTASIYGPNASDFGASVWHPAVWDALDVLRGKRSVSSYKSWEINQLKGPENTYAPYNCTEDACFGAYLGKIPQEQLHLQGRLLGGCIDVLNNLAGTGFDRVAAFNEKYREDGVLWFLECCDYNPFDLRRALWHLKHAGWFDRASGFLFGRPRLFGQDFGGLDHRKAVLDVLGEMGLPIILDADLGHLPPAMPIICGSCAEIDCGEKIDIRYYER